MEWPENLRVALLNDMFWKICWRFLLWSKVLAVAVEPDFSSYPDIDVSLSRVDMLWRLMSS